MGLFAFFILIITTSELKKRFKGAWKSYRACRLCPRSCGIDRTKNEVGFCKARLPAKIYSYRQYLGEEPPISGTKGSGVIFFSHCTMKCTYCQNYKFSQNGAGYPVTADILSKAMLSLKMSGCHNINLVTPSHYLPSILESLLLAKESSLDIPIVYNTSGYESKEALELLDGVVDIYLADMRYCDNNLSRTYSMSEDYVDVNRSAILTMHGQVGGLILDEEGRAKRGLIIRHLVLPNLLSNTEGVLSYIAEHLPNNTYISLMSQYIPLYKARENPEIARPITKKEYEAACGMLDKYNLRHGWIQPLTF